MRPETLRGRIMSPGYIERRFLAMEQEADAYWEDWKASQDKEDLRFHARYRRKAYFYLKKLTSK